MQLWQVSRLNTNQVMSNHSAAGTEQWLDEFRQAKSTAGNSERRPSKHHGVHLRDGSIFKKNAVHAWVNFLP